VPELVEFLEMNLLQVRSVPVKTQRITMSELKIREQRERIDDSRGFAAARCDRLSWIWHVPSKMADLIDGDVRVNWKETTKLVLRLKQAT